MLLGMLRVLPSLSWHKASEMRFWIDAFIEKKYRRVKRTAQKLWVVRAFVKHVFPFTAGALGKGKMGEGRSIRVAIDGRALEDFIPFYILLPLSFR